MEADRPVHKSLAEALAAFQGEAPTFHKTKTARVRTRDGGEYTYKYADLGDILPQVGPLLAKHGLSWSSKPSNEDGEMILRYVLRHVSGEEDAGEMPLGVPKGCKPQELGSAVTYSRRYALTAQLNLATDEDDDAQAAQQAERQASGNAQPTAQFAQPTERAATAKQRGLINVRAGEKQLSAAALANVVAVAAGGEARDFDTEEHAQQWLKRQLDRLPARLVDPVLEGISKAESAVAQESLGELSDAQEAELTAFVDERRRT